MKRTEIPGMADRLYLQQKSRWSADRILSVMCSIGRAVAADHALAQRATSEAALPCRNLAEIRAMCVAPPAPHRQDDERGLTPDATRHTPAARKIQTDWPSWSSPFPKPRR